MLGFTRRVSSLPNILTVKRAEISLPPKEPDLATISESIIKAAHEGIEAQQTVSDIEKAARAIAAMHGNPDARACNFIVQAIEPNRGVWLMPPEAYVRPLWMFFVQEAEAALNAVHK